MTIPAKICFFVSISSFLMGLLAFSIGSFNLYFSKSDSSAAVWDNMIFPLMLGVVCLQLALVSGTIALTM